MPKRTIDLSAPLSVNPRGQQNQRISARVYSSRVQKRDNSLSASRAGIQSQYVPFPPAVGGGEYSKFERSEHMNTKEKAPTSAATLAEAGVEIAACGRAAISCNNFTTAAAGRQRKVSDLLNRGRENAVPLRHLKKLLEVDGRTARLMIERERRSGTPICADCSTGYYLPATEEEKAACVRSMLHRSEEIRRTARAIEQAKG